ncbi:hypothetical protein Dimus_007380 [Dionaea muscipula]
MHNLIPESLHGFGLIQLTHNILCLSNIATAADSKYIKIKLSNSMASLVSPFQSQSQSHLSSSIITPSKQSSASAAAAVSSRTSRWSSPLISFSSHPPSPGSPTFSSITSNKRRSLAVVAADKDT